MKTYEQVINNAKAVLKDISVDHALNFIKNDLLLYPDRLEEAMIELQIPLTYKNEILGNEKAQVDDEPNQGKEQAQNELKSNMKVMIELPIDKAIEILKSLTK